jgi:hypothetical protein
VSIRKLLTLLIASIALSTAGAQAASACGPAEQVRRAACIAERNLC